MIAAMNHTVSGMGAIAEMRCIHQCWTPSFAEPSPLARARGVRMSSRSIALSPHAKADEPGNNRHHNAGGDNGPSRHVDSPKFESVHGVPDKVSDAAEQMQKECERKCEQNDLPCPGGESRLRDGVGLRACCSCGKPDHQRDGGDAQKYAGKPVDDRKH